MGDFNFTRKKRLNVYTVGEGNLFSHLMSVEDKEAWDKVAPALKAAGERLVLVNGEILDSTYHIPGED